MVRENRGRTRPQVEFLENRLALTDIYWIGGGEQLPGGIFVNQFEWGLGSNWVGGVVPNSPDHHVYIPARTPTHPFWPNIDDGDEYTVGSIHSIPPSPEATDKSRLEIDFDGILNIVGGTSDWNGDWLGEATQASLRREGKINLVDTVFNWRGGDIKLQHLTLAQSTFNCLQEADRLSISDVNIGFNEAVYPLPSSFNVGSRFDPDKLVGNIGLHEELILGGYEQKPVNFYINPDCRMEFKQARGNGQEGGLTYTGTTEYGVSNKGAWIFNYGEVRITGGLVGIDWVRIDTRIVNYDQATLKVLGSMSTALNSYSSISGSTTVTDPNPWKIFNLPGSTLEMNPTSEIRTVSIEGILLTKDSELVSIGEEPKILGDLTVTGGSLTIHSTPTNWRTFVLAGIFDMTSVELPGTLPEFTNGDFHFYLDINGNSETLCEQFICAGFQHQSFEGQVIFHGTTINGPQTYGWQYQPIFVALGGFLSNPIDQYLWDSPLQSYEPELVVSGLRLHVRSATLGNPTTWTAGFYSVESVDAYDDTYRRCAAGDGDQTADWDFVGIENGTYAIYANWLGGPGLSQGAVYRGYDGVENEENWIVNQQIASSQIELYGVLWNQLGTISISSGDLSIILQNVLNGDVTADAMMIVRIS